MFSKNWIFIREFYGIYVDVNIETSKRNKLCEEFKKYIEILLLDFSSSEK